MSDISLDAREVLSHLNNMGYRNISAQQLKEFMKDLKKLIKYENRFGPYQQSNGKSCHTSPEKHSTPRFQIEKRIYDSRTSSPKFSPASLTLPLYNGNSSSPKLNNKRKSTSTSISPKDCRKNITIYKNASTSPFQTALTTKPISSINSSPKSSRRTTPKTREGYQCNQRRSRSALEREHLKPTNFNERSRSACSDRTHILKSIKVSRECNSQRPQSRKSVQVIPQNKPVKGDPVQLYQYYKSEWERFKDNTPGESPRTDLRWKIRQKILKGRPQ